MKILITGPDGCGKDTQIARLQTELSGQGYSVTVITIWDGKKHLLPWLPLGQKMQILQSLLKDYPTGARSYFLMSLWKTAEEKALEQKSDIYLINGGYQKYWASEMAHGDHSPSWKVAEPQFLKPDLTFYLKADVETCLKRKENLSAYESGLKKTDVHLFQEKMHQALDEIVNTTKHYAVDASKNPDLVFSQIMGKLKIKISPAPGTNHEHPYQ